MDFWGDVRGVDLTVTEPALIYQLPDISDIIFQTGMQRADGVLVLIIGDPSPKENDINWSYISSVLESGKWC